MSFYRRLVKLFKQPVSGFVETISSSEVRGWAFHRDGKALSLVLTVGDFSFPLEPSWTERQDVAEAHGQRHLWAGFRCALSDGAATALRKATHQGKVPRVLANGAQLRFRGEVGTQTESLQFEPISVPLGSPTSGLMLDKWGHFVAQGSFASEPDALDHVTVTVEGRPLERVSLFIQPDRSQKGGTFQIELPGYIWELAGDAQGDSVELAFTVGEEDPGEHRIQLTKKKAAEWIRNIANLENWHDKQYFGMLALEHARYGRLLDTLEPEARQFVVQFAGQAGLQEFLSDGSDGSDGGDAAGVARTPASGDASSMVLWRILRELNGACVRGDAPTFEVIKAIHDRHRLNGKTKRLFVQSVIPLLCRSRQLERLREIAKFAEFHKLDQSDNDWELSLVVPLLVADGWVDWASDVMYRLQKAPRRSWLNTECLSAALDDVARKERSGEVSAASAEKFRYAFLGVIDAFGGYWFSRVHDAELIGGVVGLLRDSEQLTDHFRRDVVRACIRSYGLSPVFWRDVDRRGIRVDHPELIQAKNAWRDLADALDGRPESEEELRIVRGAVDLFHRMGNHEAQYVAREVLANNLAYAAGTLNAGIEALLDWLVARESTEAVRFSAYPHAHPEKVDAWFPEWEAGLRQLLRGMTWSNEHPSSELLGLQTSTASKLEELPGLLAAGDQNGPARLADLSDCAQHLAGWRSHFLGADVAATAYAFARSAQLDTAQYVMQWSSLASAAMADCWVGHPLPAPVVAGLRRLERADDDPLARSAVAEIRSEYRRRCGMDVAACPDIGKTILSSDALGWPADTLVVIYSCRKYLDSRIQPIRETWVRELAARGIPYLVLVGDGDDSVEGDVLNLRVSDHYEDLPKKSLALFRWVYENTDYEYVLKIDDDCYLDVERFFGALTYRKHHYYGRVIRRNFGSMDRTWHHGKSKTLHAQKVLDKSPEPSTYADGGGAYTLSREAMARLLDAARSAEGQRLISCSLMEDKLVGDLLALGSVWPSNQDYESYQRRRTFGEAIPVGMRENIFFPGRSSPTMVTHLDTAKDMQLVEALQKRTDLWPKRIWPSYAAPLIGENKNQLELLSSQETLQEVLASDAPLVVSVLRNEMIMLPHFLAHYRALGVGGFVVADNLSDDGTREFLMEQPDVVLFSADTEYKHSHYGVAWQQAILGNLCLGRWVVVADADELLVYGDCERRPLVRLVEELERDGYDAARTDMVDMYPYGDLADADFSKEPPFVAAPWFDAEPLITWKLGSGRFSAGGSWLSSLRHRIDGAAQPNAFTAQKHGLFRYLPWMRLSEGIHDATGMRVRAGKAWFAHFKYHAGFKEKVETEIRRGQHFDNAKEYQRYAAMLAEGRGSFGAPGVSRRYEGSGSFAEHLGLAAGEGGCPGTGED